MVPKQVTLIHLYNILLDLILLTYSSILSPLKKDICGKQCTKRRVLKCPNSFNVLKFYLITYLKKLEKTKASLCLNCPHMLILGNTSVTIPLHYMNAV